MATVEPKLHGNFQLCFAVHRLSCDLQLGNPDTALEIDALIDFPSQERQFVHERLGETRREHLCDKALHEAEFPWLQITSKGVVSCSDVHSRAHFTKTMCER